MKVEIDLDELILKAATMSMDNQYIPEAVCIAVTLQQQMPEGVNLTQRVRQQVKEYKKLTMWR